MKKVYLTETGVKIEHYQDDKLVGFRGVEWSQIHLAGKIGIISPLEEALLLKYYEGRITQSEIEKQLLKIGD